MFRKILKTFGLVPDRPKKIHEWRLQPTDGGLYCFFDPSIETIVILPLTTSRGAVSINEYGSVSASVGLGPGRKFLGSCEPSFIFPPLMKFD